MGALCHGTEVAEEEVFEGLEEEVIYEHDPADGRQLWLGHSLRPQYTITKIAKKGRYTKIYYDNNGVQMHTQF